MFEIEGFEFFSRLPDFVRDFQNFEWTAERIVGAFVSSLGAIGSIYGIVIKWRNSGRNRAKRLSEYLEEREDRVYRVRWDLRDIVQRPKTNSSATPKSIFKKPYLQNIALERGWKSIFGPNAPIITAIGRASEGIHLAERARETAEHELFLGHLLSGATADASGEHSAALKCFDEALRLKPDDLQALEYAGLQLVCLGAEESAIEHLDLVTEEGQSVKFSLPRWTALMRSGSDGASQADIQYLTRMLVVASIKNDDLNIARAHRAISFAFESSTTPNINMARRHAKLSAKCYPDSASPQEVGEAYERLGWLTYTFKNNWVGQAETELRQARDRYETIPKRRDKKKALARVDALILHIRKPENDRISIGFQWPIYIRNQPHTSAHVVQGAPAKYPADGIGHTDSNLSDISAYGTF